MRNAEARVTLGVVAARNGDLSQAVDLGERALAGERKSLPSLLMVSRELETEVRRRFPKDTETADYISQLRQLATA
jgi:hypothetical protein